MIDPAPRSPRAFLIKLAVVAVVVAVGALLVLRGYDVKSLIQQGLEVIRGAGPLVFYTAMALLPAVCVPLSPFSLTAGSVFGPSLGLGVAIGLGLLAITVNMVLTYFLARRTLRPLLEKIFVRLGYRLPQVGTGDAVDLIILIRVTLPFPVQNYLLGLAEVPLGKYLLYSCLVAWPVNTAFMLFGDALLQGKGRVALLSFSAILALLAATHLIRKHYGKNRT